MTQFLPQSGIIQDKIHRLPIRVFYEDTDVGQIVYHANYLRYMDRGRTELLRILGLNQGEMIKLEQPSDVQFVVKNIEIEYMAPAKLDDLLEVHTTVAKLGGASMTFSQNVMNGDKILSKGLVIVVGVNHTGKPKRISGEFRDNLVKLLNE